MRNKQDQIIIVFSLLALTCFVLLLNTSILNAKANEANSSQLFLLSPSPTSIAYKNWSLPQSLIVNNAQGAWLPSLYDNEMDKYYQNAPTYSHKIPIRYCSSKDNGQTEISEEKIPAE